MNAHFWGSLHLIQAVLPHMKRQGGGRIVNISARPGLEWRSGAGMAAYTASKAAVAALIEREIGRGIASGKIVLAGFSQGGAISLQAGLRYPQRLAGIMALSSYLPLPESLTAEGAPVSLSFVGRLHGEAALLSVGEAYQAATDFHRRRPGKFA